ncbi:MAG: helicase [Bacteroidetes bacterium]|jgi:ATP-independent RNA helicase DbpA|nr:helicase [Bacteroidota bacterium]MDF2453218.1 helicase [Bacteroidota bacterium]
MYYSSILTQFNITELNEMQKATMEAIPKPNDVVLISPTGSGKTLGFLIPILELLETEKESVQVLILVPSRELAIQIEQVFKQMNTNFKINCCYGGHSVRIEENNFQHPPAVLVGTPGRIAHHLRRKNLNLDDTKTLILDEFDKSLEFGFKDEMEYIIAQCRHLKKRILTSATHLKEIPPFVGLKQSVELNFTTEHKDLKSSLSVKTVRVEGDDKLEALMLLLGKINSKSTIVFCNHRDAVNRISEQLELYKVDHGFYHGGLEQIDREKTLIKLRNGSINLLITTDLAARGLDIPEIEAVIHYQLPMTEDVMIHRNGRTARMHANGTAYFLLDIDDYLPKFLNVIPEEESLPKKLQLPAPCEWKTLYIGAGKKDKINKMDIVGMLLQKGQLQKEELGKIEVLDHSAYAAVKANKIIKTLQLIKEEKIKNRKIKMEVSS